MKLLSIGIPSYNSQDYMRNCIESLLVGGEDVEIIIVNDGSKDDTAKIADEYASKYPTIVKAVHQENGGHGEAVNAGLRNATGVYYKVVDSDDWVNKEAYLKLLDVIRNFVQNNNPIDMIISNYVYEKVGKKHKKVVHYRNAFPQEQVFNWDNAKNLAIGQYMMMHSIIYRTQLLRDCGLVLPKHTFYVDELFIYQPLPFVKSMYYVDVDFYRYFIGRSDQSVNEKIMIKRIDQHMRVNKQMMDCCDVWKIENKVLQNYMISYIEIILCICSVMLTLDGSEEAYAKKEAHWNYLKEKDAKLYKRLRYGLFGRVMHLKGPLGRKFIIFCYHTIQSIWGFN